MTSQLSPANDLPGAGTDLCQPIGKPVPPAFMTRSSVCILFIVFKYQKVLRNPLHPLSITTSSDIGVTCFKVSVITTTEDWTTDNSSNMSTKLLAEQLPAVTMCKNNIANIKTVSWCRVYTQRQLREQRPVVGSCAMNTMTVDRTTHGGARYKYESIQDNGQLLHDIQVPTTAE